MQFAHIREIDIKHHAPAHHTPSKGALAHEVVCRKRGQRLLPALVDGDARLLAIAILGRLWVAELTGGEYELGGGRAGDEAVVVEEGRLRDPVVGVGQHLDPRQERDDEEAEDHNICWWWAVLI